MQEQSREELLVLIAALRERQPDLDEWIEPWLATYHPHPMPRGAGATVTLDLTRTQRQAARAFPYDDDWGAAGAAAGGLTELIEVGDSYAVAGQWANAQVVYSTVVEEALEHYEEVDDESGELGEVIQACAHGLRGCLEAQASLPHLDRLPPVARKALFNTLYTIWEHELNYGGGDPDVVDLPDLVARTATADEKATLTEHLRDDLDASTGADASGAWGRRERVQFLLALQGPTVLSEEAVLAEYRQAGLYQDVAAQLLAFGRVDEAIQVARKQLATPQHVTQFAEALLEREEAERGQALALVEARLQEAEAASSAVSLSLASSTATATASATTAGARDRGSAQSEQQIAHYRSWLEGRYIAFEMPGPALSIALRRFEASPDSHTYESVKKAASMSGQSANRWAELRPQLIRTLEAQAGWPALIVIYLSEGAVGEALEALEALTVLQTRPALPGWGGSYLVGLHGELQLRVARAAEQDYPQEAIQIYRRLAERIIDARDRKNYDQAATHLARVKALYEREGQEGQEGAWQTWQTYITNLRSGNKSLRALIRELDSRGLR